MFFGSQNCVIFCKFFYGLIIAINVSLLARGYFPHPVKSNGPGMNCNDL